MQWRKITLDDMAQSLGRYMPFVALVAAIALVVAFLPGDPRTGPPELSLGGKQSQSARGPNTSSGTGGGTAGTPGRRVTGQGGGATGVEGGGQTTAPGGGGGGGPAPVEEGGVAADAPGPECDTGTSRIRVPSLRAASCVNDWTGKAGSPYQGVTPEEIVVAVYQGETNAATEAALTAAGANDEEEDTRATLEAYVDYFNAHYEQYGRQVKIVYKEGSGESDDDQAGRADAIDVATNMKAFASWGAPNNAYVDELVARGVMCICTVSQPQEFYEQRAPYAGYTTLMSSTQGYIHRAEYVGKRLAFEKAEHAGDPVMQTQERVFGLLYFETPDQAYKAGVDFFEKELTKYDVKLKVRQAFTGAIGPGSNPARTQEQARPMIAKLREEGVNNVLMASDPLSPSFFTQEATRQQYFPEWTITGSALTDTTLFARTYDQEQWQNAFGISFLSARSPEEESDPYRLHVWHHGKPPQASNTYGVIYATPWIFFTGVHLAGPELNPLTFQQGLFSYPVTGQGLLTQETVSWGDHGLWPFTDYTAYDDVTEIWWDRTATGEDEVGNPGTGMYQYVDGGARYVPGGHPDTKPKAFEPGGAVTTYDSQPESDKPPEYEHQHYD